MLRTQSASPVAAAFTDQAWAKEHAEAKALAQENGMRFAVAEELFDVAEPSLFSGVSRRFLDTQRVLPIFRRERRVIAATTVTGVQWPELATSFGVESIEPWIVTPTDFRRLRMALSLGQVGAKQAKEPAVRAGDLLEAGERGHPQIVALFEEILLDAIGERASDVHLEQYGSRIRVRLRIDGDLRDIHHFQLSAEQCRGIVNIIKVRAGLNIAECRVPQGGRFTVSAGEQSFDVRVQTQPSHHGEHVVMRLLPHSVELLTIDRLGFPEPLARAYRRLLQAPSGLLIVAGPTGCGKSTTLYAGLQFLAADASRKVITIEDPIEYTVANVQQTQVHVEVGFGFANAMRAFVRQDPDVILIGEVRDQETALETIRASQTGHLVLTTLHAGEAVDTLQRLFDLGMHPNSSASELLGVISQRLARRICGGCRYPAVPDPALVREVFPSGPPPDLSCFTGRGCHQCGWHGVFGRVAVLEYLPSSPALRRGISHQLPLDELRALAVAEGLSVLREHALELVRQGVISLDELPFLMSPERLRPEQHP